MFVLYNKNSISCHSLTSGEGVLSTRDRKTDSSARGIPLNELSNDAEEFGDVHRLFQNPIHSAFGNPLPFVQLPAPSGENDERRLGDP